MHASKHLRRVPLNSVHLRRIPALSSEIQKLAGPLSNHLQISSLLFWRRQSAEVQDVAESANMQPRPSRHQECAPTCTFAFLHPSQAYCHRVSTCSSCMFLH